MSRVPAELLQDHLIGALFGRELSQFDEHFSTHFMQ
jgi:hypothetical protein